MVWGWDGRFPRTNPEGGSQLVFNKRVDLTSAVGQDGAAARPLEKSPREII